MSASSGHNEALAPLYISTPMTVSRDRKTSSVSPKSSRPINLEGRRRELVDVALNLFQEKGFDATTVNDISASVGVTERTFFRYFQSKDDVAFVWVESQGLFVRPVLASRPLTESSFEATRQTLLALSDWHDLRRKEVKFLIRLIFETPSLGGRYHFERERWETDMAETLRNSRVFSPAELLTLRVQVGAAVNTFVTALRSWSHGSEKTLIRAHVESAFTALAEGFATP